MATIIVTTTRTATATAIGLSKARPLATAWLACSGYSQCSSTSVPRELKRSISSDSRASALVYARHGKPDVLSLHQYTLPPLSSHELRVRTLAAPINPADINQVEGTYASKPTWRTNLGTEQPVAVPGNEGVYEIEDVGSALQGQFQPGAWAVPRVSGLGSWRTHLNVAADQIIQVDKSGGLEAQDVARISVNPLTALRLLTDFVQPATSSQSAHKSGGWVVLNGANSGVGRSVLQLARHRGLQTLAIVRERRASSTPTDSESKTPSQDHSTKQLSDELRQLGATAVVTEEQLESLGADELHSTLKDITSDQPVRLALDGVGGRSGVRLARMLSEGGRHVTYGNMSRTPLRVSPGMLIFRDIHFQGFWLSRWADHNPQAKEDGVQELLALVRTGQLQLGPVMTTTWSSTSTTGDLTTAVMESLEGYRSGKGMFVFSE